MNYLHLQGNNKNFMHIANCRQYFWAKGTGTWTETFKSLLYFNIVSDLPSEIFCNF